MEECAYQFRCCGSPRETSPKPHTDVFFRYSVCVDVIFSLTVLFITHIESFTANWISRQRAVTMEGFGFPLRVSSGYRRGNREEER